MTLSIFSTLPLVNQSSQTLKEQRSQMRSVAAGMSGIMKSAASCILLILCTGCAGSAFLYGDDAPEGDFPTLHSVPDRPTNLRPPSAYAAERQEIEANHQQALQKAGALRRATGTSN